MNSYLIINPTYTGAVQVTYNSNGLLSKIDFAETNLTANNIAKFKQIVPSVENDLASSFGEKTQILKADVTITWKMMYGDWPYKRNAFAGEKVWVKMNKEEQAEAYYNKIEYKKYCRRQQAKYDYQPMMIDRYLRQKEYQTEWNKI